VKDLEAIFKELARLWTFKSKFPAVAPSPPLILATVSSDELLLNTFREVALFISLALAWKSESLVLSSLKVLSLSSVWAFLSSSRSTRWVSILMRALMMEVVSRPEAKPPTEKSPAIIRSRHSPGFDRGTLRLSTHGGPGFSLGEVN